MSNVSRRLVGIDSATTMNVVDMGAGPAIVFLHGSGPGASGWNNFRHNAAVLAHAGYRCLMPDLIGFGHSSKPTDVQFTLDYLAATIHTLLDHLEISSCTLVGNSLGGAIAIRCALDRPERIERLVLMAPGWLEEREVFAQMDGIIAMRGTLLDPRGLLRENLERTLRLMFFDPARLPEGLVDERMELARLQNGSVYTNLSGYNLVQHLPALTQPVLGFWGYADRFCPVSGAMSLVRHCRRARVVLQHDCGHWFMIEKAPIFDRELLAFLSE
jgi:4,5:9,10-diseco-3-hydroxy-5,9,17-trioxoandrosta-1(10),2-diene-4-oate hydrolase